MAELQDPIVASSIFALVALTRAGNWTTVDEGLDFVVRLIKTFLIGFAIPTGVSLLILPRTCRQGVCKDIRNFVQETNAVLQALTEFVNTASRTSFLTRQKTHVVSEDDASSQDDNELPSEVRFAKARSRLTKASDTLNALDAKIQAGLRYSRDEVAWGKLSAADLDEISMLLRGVLLPLSGMSLLPDIVNSFTEAESRLHPTEDGPTIDGQAPIGHGIIDALSECLGDTRTLVSTGVQYFLLQLELSESGAKKKPSDSEACTRESMPMELDPSSPDFVSSFGLKIHEMSEAKQNLRADAFLVRTSSPPSQHASDDNTSETTQRIDRDMIIQQDFLLVLYLFSLQTMVLDATLNLIRFAKRKTDDDTMKKAGLIIPACLHPKRSRDSASTGKEASAQPSEQQDTAREVQGLEVVDLVHLKPANVLERGSDWFRSVSHLLGSDLSMFGLRVAAASLSIGIVAFLRQSHHFFIHQRGIWAMIVVVIGMSPTSGQSFFGFFARILATAVSVALSLIAWYIVAGKTPGVIIFLYLANVIEVSRIQPDFGYSLGYLLTLFSSTPT